MISLKRYLNAAGETPSGQGEGPLLRQLLSLFIERIGSSAVEGDPGEFTAFTADIRQIADGLVPDLPPGDFISLAVAAGDVLTAHNNGIARLIASQASEVKHILGML